MEVSRNGGGRLRVRSAWRWGRWGSLAALVLALAPGTGAAQTVTGTIRGLVVDPDGGVVQKAAVLIVDEATGLPRASETGTRGTFEAPNLQPGSYRIELVATGYLPWSRDNVVVTADRCHVTPVSVQASLTPAT